MGETFFPDPEFLTEVRAWRQDWVERMTRWQETSWITATPEEVQGLFDIGKKAIHRLDKVIRGLEKANLLQEKEVSE